MCVCVCLFFTLVHTAVFRRVGPSSCRPASRHLAEWVASIDALPGAESHAGAGAGADVGRRVGQPREVLRLGGRHREAHRCHGSSLGNSRRGGEGCGVGREGGRVGLGSGQGLAVLT